jgi:hypothetical protein
MAYILLTQKKKKEKEVGIENTTWKVLNGIRYLSKGLGRI